jgi:glucose-6-phosphate isomerase
MINLEKISGLPIELTDDFHLKFNEPLVQREPSFIRKFKEAVPVLMDPKTLPPKEGLYFVYRGVAMPEDKDWIAANHLTYDITILPPMMLGAEFNKTIGHYHANIPGSEIAHPEMYEILNGKATILMQKMDHGFKNLISIVYLEVEAGDKVIYPANYGHILINTGTEPLVTANWLSSDYKPLYDPVKEMHGMAYYLIADENGQPKFVENGHYHDLPAPRETHSDYKILADFGFNLQEPMYLTARKNPKALEFLSNPEKYAVELSAVSS